MPRFVVLEHDHPTLHWDWMLEDAGRLKTWRLPVFPPMPAQELRVQALADHRLQYLNYEGPVSGGRGQVIRRDQGTYDFVPFSEDAGDVCAENMFTRNRLLLSLTGGRLCGLILLERLDGDAWRLELQRDPPLAA